MLVGAVVDLSKITRVCSICEQEKYISSFEKNSTKKYGHGYRCNDCNRKRSRERYKPREVSLGTCNWCHQWYSKVNKEHKYCSSACREKSTKDRNKMKFIQSMVTPKRKADGLTALDIMNKYEEQEGKCALTDVPLTFEVGNGGAPTNISIDRIEAGESYSPDNIQLVCKAVNSFRNNLSIGEFIYWCELVAGKARGGRKSK